MLLVSLFLVLVLIC